MSITKHDAINVIELMTLVEFDMEYTEKVRSNGETKRNMVIQSIITMID